MSHPGREPGNFSVYHDGMDFLLIALLPKMEKDLPNHPFKKILAPEITRYKKEINYDNVFAEAQQVISEIDNQFIVK